MKERLIAFTRNNERKAKLKIVILVTIIIYLALLQFEIIETQNIVLKLIVIIPTMLISFITSWIYKFFDVDEKIIKYNNMATIIMAYTTIVGDLLFLFFSIIVIVQATTINSLGMLMVLIAIEICHFVSKRVNGQYREKIKTY